jgi:hypothetical protein
LSKSCQEVVKSCQKIVKKLSKSCQKVVRKFSKNVTKRQKVVKKCQKVVKIFSTKKGNGAIVEEVQWCNSKKKVKSPMGQSYKREW